MVYPALVNRQMFLSYSLIQSVVIEQIKLNIKLHIIDIKQYYCVRTSALHNQIGIIGVCYRCLGPDGVCIRRQSDSVSLSRIWRNPLRLDA